MLPVRLVASTRLNSSSASVSKGSNRSGNAGSQEQTPFQRDAQILDLGSTSAPGNQQIDGCLAEASAPVIDANGIGEELISQMRNCCKLLTGRHLTTVQDWLKLLIKVSKAA